MAILDVRPILAAGDDPFAEILAAVAALGPGEVLELIAPLDPVPLYAVLAARGFSHVTERLGEGDFRITFRRTDGS